LRRTVSLLGFLLGAIAVILLHVAGGRTTLSMVACGAPVSWCASLRFTAAGQRRAPS